MTTVDSVRPAAPAQDTAVYKGACFCGAVQLTVTGAPAAVGYCHCESCRTWSAAPVNAFTLWQPGAVRVTRGADNIGTYNKTPRSARKWCKTAAATSSPSIRIGISPTSTRRSSPTFRTSPACT
jgi:hypothetical protein